MDSEHRESSFTYYESSDNHKEVEAFRVEAESFMMKAEKAMRNSRGSADSNSPDQKTTQAVSSQILHKGSLVVNGIHGMMDKVRGRRELSKDGGNMLRLECDALMDRQRKIEEKINKRMEISLHNESILLDNSSLIWQHVCCCILHNSRLSLLEKEKIDTVSSFVGSIDSVLMDLESTAKYMMQVKMLDEDDERFSLTPAIYKQMQTEKEEGAKSEQQRQQELEAKKNEVTIEEVNERAGKLRLVRATTTRFLTRLLKQRAAQEASLSFLKESRDSMKLAIEDVVPLDVDKWIETKLHDQRPFDHNLCNDCDTFASMGCESLGLLEESHRKATDSAQLLQQTLMMGASLSSTKLRLQELMPGQQQQQHPPSSPAGTPPPGLEQSSSSSSSSSKETHQHRHSS
jgi:hypothetical protein